MSLNWTMCCNPSGAESPVPSVRGVADGGEDRPAGTVLVEVAQRYGEP